MGLNFVPVFEHFDQLIWGALNTVWLGFAGMLAAVLMGVLGAAGSTLGPHWIRRAVASYVYFFRGTPLLTQIIAAFYLPSLFGYNMGAVPVGIICLGLYFGAYITEIVRAAVEAIPSGQIDVARAFGMPTPLLFRRIILPQVVATVIPPLAGQFTSLVKATSLLSVITVQELTLEGRIIIIRTVAPLETYILIAAIYFVINSFIAVASVRLETHFRRYM
jgi:polar amino acid transport system permease protein